LPAESTAPIVIMLGSTMSAGLVSSKPESLSLLPEVVTNRTSGAAAIASRRLSRDSVKY
jgi:hypothetical protein